MAEDVRGMILEELLPLGNVLIGAVAAILGGYLADKRRWKYEDTYRDYDQRREAYLRFISACDRVHEGEMGKEMFIELKRSGQNIKLVTRSKRVSDVAEGLFLLLGPDATGGTPPMKDPVRYDTLLSEFYEATREDLDKPPFR